MSFQVILAGKRRRTQVALELGAGGAAGRGRTRRRPATLVVLVAPLHGWHGGVRRRGGACGGEGGGVDVVDKGWGDVRGGVERGGRERAVRHCAGMHAGLRGGVARSVHIGLQVGEGGRHFKRCAGASPHNEKGLGMYCGAVIFDNWYAHPLHVRWKKKRSGRVPPFTARSVPSVTRLHCVPSRHARHTVIALLHNGPPGRPARLTPHGRLTRRLLRAEAGRGDARQCMRGEPT